MAALTPLDIKNKSFSTKFKGYSPEEVDDFLDQIIEDYEESLRKSKELEKSLKYAEEKLTYFSELKDTLNQSIIVAQNTADKLKDTATKESNMLVSGAEAEAKQIMNEATTNAEKMVSEARSLADEIVTSAQRQAKQLAVETDDLKKKTREFHRNLALTIESQLEIVKSPEWDEILRPFSSFVDERHSTFKELLDEKNAANNEEVAEVVESTDYLVEEGHTQAIDLSELTQEYDVENNENI
ncbi:DivIVA domain-containing protein [Vagococcus zengguangii]|uniref:DivIVA domain-containing protein n=1 Tax=Vagococcus zengguangii TaxID=2571750 RepID=A0A4D7CU04_9ENTE|nr:DivIVA domain-containing protein [Vagococcus zengguangii]QCI86753.1 DivIVA domain-containing protein [Vagococcus zengguangii]TLG79486.1 DivIVA domain-containing protein [Vagococcus zengguangii]